MIAARNKSYVTSRMTTIEYVSLSAGGRAGYTTGDGFLLQSNYTTGAVTVAGVANLCASRAPAFPVVEATIGSVHTVSHGRPSVGEKSSFTSCLKAAAVVFHLE